jgi:hypothetical protein
LIGSISYNVFEKGEGRGQESHQGRQRWRGRDGQISVPKEMQTKEVVMLYYPGDEHAPEDCYLTARDAITYLGVEPDQFYAEIWDTLTKYRLPAVKYTLFYRLSDLGRKKAAGSGRRKKKMNNPITYQQSRQPLSFKQQELVERSINRTLEKLGEVIPTWPFHPDHYQETYLQAKRDLLAALHQLIVWTAQDRLEDLVVYLLSQGWQEFDQNRHQYGDTRGFMRPCTGKNGTGVPPDDYLALPKSESQRDYEHMMINLMYYLASIENTSSYAILCQIHALSLKQQEQEPHAN